MTSETRERILTGVWLVLIWAFIISIAWAVTRPAATAPTECDYDSNKAILYFPGYKDCEVDMYPTVYALKYEFTEEDGKIFYESIMDAEGYIYFTSNDHVVSLFYCSCREAAPEDQMPDTLELTKVIIAPDGRIVFASCYDGTDTCPYGSVVFLFRKDADTSTYKPDLFVRKMDGWACYYSLTHILSKDSNE